MLEKKEAEKAARKLPELSKDAQHSLTVLKKAKEYLEAKPEIAEELSAAERRKRAQLKSKPVYKYVALIISLFGVVAAASTRCSPTAAITAFTLPCLALRPSSSSPATT